MRMKKIFTTLLVVVGLMTVMPSQAQVKFGVKGGINLTEMKFSKDVAADSNKNGFFIGPSAKFTLPLVGIGVDAGLLYDQRDAEIGDKTVSQRSIVIPINFRYSIGLGSLASIYAAAGPQFGYNIGSKTFNFDELSQYSLSNSNFSINLGAGVSLLNHLEVGLTYNIACGKTGEANYRNTIESAYQQLSKGRANAWQVSAAYYF